MTVVAFVVAVSIVPAADKGPRKVDLFMAGSTASLVAIDIVLAVQQRPTFSQRIRYWSNRTLVVPWASGLLAGHLFHPFKGGQSTSPYEIAAMVTLTAVAVFVVPPGKVAPRWVQPIAFAAGFASGMLLWK